MSNLKCKIIPVITAGTKIVTRGLRENQNAIPGKHSIDPIQKKSYTWNVMHNTASTAI